MAEAVLVTESPAIIYCFYVGHDDQQQDQNALHEEPFCLREPLLSALHPSIQFLFFVCEERSLLFSVAAACYFFRLCETLLGRHSNHQHKYFGGKSAERESK